MISVQLKASRDRIGVSIEVLRKIQYFLCLTAQTIYLASRDVETQCLECSYWRPIFKDGGLPVTTGGQVSFHIHSECLPGSSRRGWANIMHTDPRATIRIHGEQELWDGFLQIDGMCRERRQNGTASLWTLVKCHGINWSGDLDENFHVHSDTLTKIWTVALPAEIRINDGCHWSDVIKQRTPLRRLDCHQCYLSCASRQF